MSKIDKQAAALAAFHKASRKGRPREPRPVTMPSQPTAWDKGAMGEANRKGLIEEASVEIDPETGRETPNPNGVKRMRRVDLLEHWLKKGDISAKGFNAAVKLRDAFLATQKVPAVDMGQDRVDSSPKPDHAVTIHIERLSRYHAYAKHISAGDKAIIENCVIDGCSPRALRQYRNENYRKGLAHLHDALERLHDAIC